MSSFTTLTHRHPHRLCQPNHDRKVPVFSPATLSRETATDQSIQVYCPDDRETIPVSAAKAARPRGSQTVAAVERGERSCASALPPRPGTPAGSSRFLSSSTWPWGLWCDGASPEGYYESLTTWDRATFIFGPSLASTMRPPPLPGCFLITSMSSMRSSSMMSV